MIRYTLVFYVAEVNEDGELAVDWETEKALDYCVDQENKLTPILNSTFDGANTHMGRRAGREGITPRRPGAR